nr:o-succinylbenzoate synthase [Bacteriovorax sp. HI3]
MMDVKLSFETLSYTKPVPVRGKVISKNRFLKVTLLERDYFISVLPGFHESSLEELSLKIKRFFTSYSLNFSAIDFDKKFFNLVGSDTFLDSLKAEALFNIEAILLGMIRTTHPQLFSHEEILINDLYRPGDELEKFKNSQCVKIKIDHNLLATRNLLIELHQTNPELKFRLDGNRQFELNEMIEFYQILKTHIPERAFYNIDYIEEPFKNFYDTLVFEKRAEIPVAIDESFEQLAARPELPWPAVIKPSLFGISFVSFWLRNHPENRAVISSSFEHPTIMEGLYFLARKRSMEFHGLSHFL